MTQTEFFSPIAAVSKPRAMVLLGSIEAIILSDGFARLCISDLAERLSCSKRTIYEIAPTKNALVLKVLGDFFAQIRTDAAFAATTKPLAAERLHDYLQAGAAGCATSESTHRRGHSPLATGAHPLEGSHPSARRGAVCTH